MLPLKTLAYLGLFSLALLASIFYHPIAGILAYLVTYNINPMGQWWGGFLPGIFERYSLLLAGATGLGILIHHAKLRHRRFWESQEILLLLFLCAIGLSLVVGQGMGLPYNVTKMAKVVLILFMASHIITTTKYFEAMIWVFILAGLYLSIEMYGGTGITLDGRYHSGIGGSDFAEGNFLAAHFGLILPFVGVMFLKGNWKTKAICLVAGVFIINSIVMTRSRGIFIALAIGLFASLIYTSRLKQYRKKILALTILGLFGAVYLTDSGFWGRIETIETRRLEERDTSAEGRLAAWRGAWQIAMDYPLGIGVGNFVVFIGLYNPSIEGKDTHNTYLRCLAELGFQGLFILLLLIGNAFRILRTINKNLIFIEDSLRENFILYVFALRVSLIVYLTAAMFISSVFIEELYWLLLMPVFLKRSMENEMADRELEGKEEAGQLERENARKLGSWGARP